MNKKEAVWSFVFSAIYVLAVAASGWFLYALGRFPSRIELFDFAIVAFAVFRLIRLFVYDWITQYIRDYFGKFPEGPRHTMSDLLSCPWCTGIWVALLASFFYFLTPLAWYPLFLIALAGVGTYLQIIIIRIGKDI